MPDLFRPTIVEYRLKNGSFRTPDGKRVTKDTPGRVKTTRKAAKWYGRVNGEAVPLPKNKDIALAG